MWVVPCGNSLWEVSSAAVSLSRLEGQDMHTWNSNFAKSPAIHAQHVSQ